MHPLTRLGIIYVYSIFTIFSVYNVFFQHLSPIYCTITHAHTYIMWIIQFLRLSDRPSYRMIDELAGIYVVGTHIPIQCEIIVICYTHLRLFAYIYIYIYCLDRYML